MSPRRVDDVQPECVAAMRAVGASVWLLHMVGHGGPDALIGYHGRNILMEFKGRYGTLTPDEVRWHREWWGEPVCVVRSVAQALRAIGAEEVCDGG